MKTYSQSYLDGISEGRATYKREGMENAEAHLNNLKRLSRLFDAQSPVGQLYRGEIDFWTHKIKAAGV
jgi:hypothetical protein